MTAGNLNVKSARESKKSTDLNSLVQQQMVLEQLDEAFAESSQLGVWALVLQTQGVLPVQVVQLAAVERLAAESQRAVELAVFHNLDFRAYH
jgi:hypothetical protein